MKDFKLGCNYWASHAGTEMWKNWDEEQVDKDLAALSAGGVRCVRVFPLWRDFQPVMPVYSCSGVLEEYMLEGCIEPTNPWFLDDVMMERFATFLDICGKYNISAIVGLITGWMSGRMFLPSALYGKHLTTDPVALMFEQKFVHGFVEAFRGRKEIYAWDLGNECNCLAKTTDRAAAYVWSATISNAIKAQDSTRPVISGMHGLKVEGAWTIGDQGEITDILTTHPYAFFVPHCKTDPMDSYRTLLHGTCESALYASISGKGCLVEELGTLSYNVCNDDVSARFMRANLFSNWANGAEGVLWWCAHDQNTLETPPYSWNSLERELGMLNSKLEPKPVLNEMKDFGKWLDNLDFEIEKPKCDGIILLSKEQDHWGIAYMTYLLGKQAGVTLDFLAPNKEIPDSDVYFLPSTIGQSVLYKKYYDQLKRKVEEGATLYVSNDSGYFTELLEFFGLSVAERELRCVNGEMDIGGYKIPWSAERRVVLTPEGSEVICKDSEGNPLLTLNRYGKGKVYYLNVPFEQTLLTRNRAFDGNAHKLYELVLSEVLEKKKVRKSHPKAAITENGNIVTVINYSNEAIDPGITLAKGVEVGKIYRGSFDSIAPCDALVFSIK